MIYSTYAEYGITLTSITFAFVPSPGSING